jgi:hypothetical protein
MPKQSQDANVALRPAPSTTLRSLRESRAVPLPRYRSRGRMTRARLGAMMRNVAAAAVV